MNDKFKVFKMSFPKFFSELRLVLIIAVSLSLMYACGVSKFKTPKEYYSYINNIDNGLCLQKHTPEIELSVKYLPPELRVLQEESAINVINVDSLVSCYSRSFSFLFTLSPGEKCYVDDLKYYGIESQEEFSDRQSFLHYSLGECFTIECEGKIYSPKLCHLEQDHGYSGKLRYHLVFIPSEQACKEKQFYTDDIRLIFNDPIFNTAQNQFVFDSKSLNAIPQIEINHE